MRRLLSVAAVALVACGGASERPSARPPLLPPGPPAAAASAAPTADPAPVVEGDVTTGSVAGVQVIVKHVPGAAFAAGQLYVRGGTRNWTAANAGIEELAFRAAASGGTASLDKRAYSRKLAALGADISGAVANDFSSLSLKVPVGAWDDAFALLADVFRRPALPASEVNLARAQLLAQLHHEQEDPEGQLWTLERKQIFAGHPYANRPIGTLESTAAIPAAALGPYLSNLRETTRLLFVAAGDLDASRVFAQVQRAYGDLPRGHYEDTPLPPLAFGASHVVVQQRKLPTNYCQTVFPAPHWSDPDSIAGQVAMHGFSWRLWQEVRTKRNLTYSVHASIYGWFAQPFGSMSVSTVDPNAAMKVMLDEARRLRDEPIGEEELAGFKSTFLTSYLEQHETTEGQASSLADGQLYGGDWHIAKTFPDRVRAVTAADVQAFAKKYFGHLQAAVVGDPAKVDTGLFTSL